MNQITWHKYETDIPPFDTPVMVLMTWSKLNHRMTDGSEAEFYQPFFGRFVQCDDEERRFFLDHGNADFDEPGDEGEDWIDIQQLPYWAHVSMPNRLGERVLE